MAEDRSPARRFHDVAAAFTAVVDDVPPDRWTWPAPCAGWTAADIVHHLLEWVPAVIGRAGIDVAPPAGSDLPAAWRTVRDRLQQALDDEDLASIRFDAGPPGMMTVQEAIDRLVLGDVLVHSWDLAMATGLPVTLDETVAAEMLAGMEPMDELLRLSGHFGPRVPVAPDAGVVEQLLAFTGRDPKWSAAAPQ